MRAEQLADPVAYHAEGPGWSDADGRLDEVIEVDAAKTTACCLGGPRLDRLFITTSRENLPDCEDALAGALFVADVGVAGLPARVITCSRRDLGPWPTPTPRATILKSGQPRPVHRGVTMSTREELKARTKAVRSVADRAGGVSRFEWAMQRYLSAEVFQAHLDTAPESWEGSRPAPLPRPIRRLG